MYTNIAGPRYGGLFVDYEQNPKFQAPKQPKKTDKSVVNSDGYRELTEDGKWRTVKPSFGGDNQRPLLFPCGFCIAFSPRVICIRLPVFNLFS